MVPTANALTPLQPAQTSQPQRAAGNNPSQNPSATNPSLALPPLSTPKLVWPILFFILAAFALLNTLIFLLEFVEQLSGLKHITKLPNFSSQMRALGGLLLTVVNLFYTAIPVLLVVCGVLILLRKPNLHRWVFHTTLWGAIVGIALFIIVTFILLWSMSVFKDFAYFKYYWNHAPLRRHVYSLYINQRYLMNLFLGIVCLVAFIRKRDLA